MVPKSISFAKMNETEFAELYSNVLDVILKNIPDTYTKIDIENAVDDVLGFA
jgi:hypothetical protein